MEGQLNYKIEIRMLNSRTGKRDELSHGVVVPIGDTGDDGDGHAEGNGTAEDAS